MKLLRKTPDYLLFLESRFEANAHLENALRMQQYMKDKFSFYGMKAPLRREIFREHDNLHGLIPADEREYIVKWCWDAPQRDWQYFAMEFLGKEARKADKKRIELYQFMICHKSWWDTVDYIAVNLVGPYFRKFPERNIELTEIWMESGNVWLQRTCLLFQLKYKQTTNTDLLEQFILRLKESKEFFIRKAIGWALREYSKTDPEYVKSFVAEHKLSGLSHREALKWLINKGMY